jgi:hypothetical protein
MATSRTSKEATFYHNSDHESTKIKVRSTLSVSARIGRGGRHSSRPSHPSKVDIGRGAANRPYAVARVADQFWEEETGYAEYGKPKVIPNSDGTEGEDETRFWPWMTDMEKEWEPPSDRPELDLLAMAKPTKRKGKPSFHRDRTRERLS